MARMRTLLAFALAFVAVVAYVQAKPQAAEAAPEASPGQAVEQNPPIRIEVLSQADYDAVFDFESDELLGFDPKPGFDYDNYMDRRVNDRFHGLGADYGGGYHLGGSAGGVRQNADLFRRIAENRW